MASNYPHLQVYQGSSSTPVGSSYGNEKRGSPYNNERQLPEPNLAGTSYANEEGGNGNVPQVVLLTTPPIKRKKDYAFVIVLVATVSILALGNLVLMYQS